MDAGTIQNAVVIGGTALSAALWLWNRGTAKGRHDELVATLAKQRKEDQVKFQNAEQHRLNQNLRIFQAIEELRRRLGNGDRSWTDLTGD